MPFKQLTFIDNSELIYEIDPQYRSRKSRESKTHTQSKGALCWYYSYKILGTSNEGAQLTTDQNFNLLKDFKRSQLRADTKGYIIDSFFETLLSESVKDDSDAIADLNLHLSQEDVIIQRFINGMTGNGTISKAMIDKVSVADIYTDIISIRDRVGIKSSLTHEEIRTEVNRYRYTTKYDEAIKCYNDLKYLKLQSLSPVDIAKLEEGITCTNQLEKLANIISVFKSLMIHCYGLVIDSSDSLNKISSPLELLTFLKDNGPTAVPGQFGSMFYSEQPVSLSRMLGNRHLYSWRRGTRKEEVTEAFSDAQRFLKTHNIIIIGVKINQEDPLKSHVYFVDPNYTSEPSKAFAMSFKLFLEKMDRVNQVVSEPRPRS